MDYGIGEALNSLNDYGNRRDSRDRGLRLMEKIQQSEFTRRERDKQAQSDINAYDDKVNEFADTLLESDRESIQKLATSQQEIIQARIAKFGGNVDRFLANGGTSEMQKYKNSVIYSPEASQYKSNADNMSKIIKTRDSGKGHLMLKRDLANAEAYEVNGGGVITYGGMLSEIKKVDTKGFKRGVEIDPSIILKHDNNQQIIYSNYTLEHPDEGPPTAAQLLSYTKEKYGAIGTAYQQPTKAQTKTKQNSKTKTNQNLTVVTGTDNMYRSFGNDGVISSQEVFDNEEFISASVASKGYIGAKYTAEGVVEDAGFAYLDSRPKSLYGSHLIYDGADVSGFMKSVNSGAYNSGTNTFTLNSSMMFDSEGKKQTNGSDIGNLRAVAFVTGLKGSSAKEGEMLMMKSDDADYQKDIKDGFENGQFKLGTYVALRDDLGQQFFMPVDTSIVTVNNALDQSMGALNKTKSFSEQNQLIGGINQMADQSVAGMNKQAKVNTNAVRNTEEFANKLTSVTSMYALSNNRNTWEAVVFGLSGNSNIDHKGGAKGMVAFQNLISSQPNVLNAFRRKTSTFEDIMAEMRSAMVFDLTDEADIQSVDARIELMRGYHNTLMS